MDEHNSNNNSNNGADDDTTMPLKSPGGKLKQETERALDLKFPKWGHRRAGEEKTEEESTQYNYSNTTDSVTAEKEKQYQQYAPFAKNETAIEDQNETFDFLKVPPGHSELRDKVLTALEDDYTQFGTHVMRDHDAFRKAIFLALRQDIEPFKPLPAKSSLRYHNVHHHHNHQYSAPSHHSNHVRSLFHPQKHHHSHHSRSEHDKQKGTEREQNLPDQMQEKKNKKTNQNRDDWSMNEKIDYGNINEIIRSLLSKQGSNMGTELLNQAFRDDDSSRIVITDEEKEEIKKCSTGVIVGISMAFIILLSTAIPFLVNWFSPDFSGRATLRPTAPPSSLLSQTVEPSPSPSLSSLPTTATPSTSTPTIDIFQPSFASPALSSIAAQPGSLSAATGPVTAPSSTRTPTQTLEPTQAPCLVDQNGDFGDVSTEYTTSNYLYEIVVPSDVGAQEVNVEVLPFLEIALLNALLLDVFSDICDLATNRQLSSSSSSSELPTSTVGISTKPADRVLPSAQCELLSSTSSQQSCYVIDGRMRVYGDDVPVDTINDLINQTMQEGLYVMAVDDIQIITMGYINGTVGSRGRGSVAVATEEDALPWWTIFIIVVGVGCLAAIGGAYAGYKRGSQTDGGRVKDMEIEFRQEESEENETKEFWS